MEILIYTIVVFVIWLVLCIKDIKEDVKNYISLFIFGVLIGFVTENILIFSGFYHYNVDFLIINFTPIVIPLYVFHLSFAYYLSKLIKKKYPNINYWIVIFFLGTIIGLIFDLTAINLVNYWNHTFGPEIFNVSITAPFAEGFLTLIIFYFTSLFTKLKLNGKTAYKRIR